MTLFEVLTIIIGILGLSAAVAAFVALSRDKKDREQKERERAVAEGQKAQEFEQMKRDLAAAQDHVRDLEIKNNDVGRTLERINTVLERLVQDVADLGNKLDAYREEQLKGGCK